MSDGASWETCSGTFYDSGGAAGAYGALENMTATLCPSGGAGAGPLSSITFTVWDVNVLDLFDGLVIHDGASVSDPVLATGNGLNSLLGQTFTATDPSGCLTFEWHSDLLLNGNGWAAEINTGPDAGGDGSATVCSNAAAFNLFALLTGTPDPGGQWSLGGDLVSNIYTPGVSTPGVYVYTVLGVPPCANATASVTIAQMNAPDAGTNNAITVCSNGAAFAMRPQLLGAPDAGGTWSGPSPVVGGQYAPVSMLPGIYTYTVTGTAPCTDANAQLTITEQAAPDAGASDDTTVCSNAAVFDLLSVLDGTPEGGGAWTGPGNVPHGSQFLPGVDAAGAYQYRVTGTAPCADAVATVTVNVTAAPNPGTSTTKTVCSNGASFNMRTLLGTTATGSWTGPSTVTNNTYNPVSMDPGVYTFTVQGTAPCTALSATVNVIEIQAPNAGTDGTKSVCSNGAQVVLFNRLGNTPDAGGTWSPGNGIYTPGLAAPGTYVFTYTVQGTAPCANDAATVTVTEVGAPNAGTNGSLTICSNDAPEPLINHLGNSPQSGGQWYRPTPPGGTFGGTYNPQNAGHPAGVYSYVVQGTAPCVADTATVSVVENAAPNAGTNDTITLCSTSAPVNLITGLGGSPNGSGTWLSPTNQPFAGGVFHPMVDPTGAYKYIVTGIAPCANDTGFVTVVVNTAPTAGSNGTISVCSNDGPVQLFTALGATPDAGGTWNPGNGTYTPGAQAAGTRVYTYTVAGLSPCVSASATVTVTERRLPVAGGDGAVTVCSNEPALNLFSRLSGTPDAGGTWSPGDPAGVFTPGTSAAGTYTYTLNGTAPCPNVSAHVVVTVIQAPNPGIANDQTICQTQTSIDLFTALTGNPDLNGTWSAQGPIAPGTLVGSVFTTNGAPPGTYHFRYSVPAIGQCPGAHTDVEVRITSALNAGSNGSKSVCHTNTQYNLFNALGSNPQSGGVWVPIGNTAVLNGQYLNATQLQPSPPTYVFRYRLTGTGGCQPDSATATITIVDEANAGNDATLAICSTAGPNIPLFPLLGGNAQPGGTWKRLCNNNPFNGTYNTTSDTSCVFLYIKPGSSPCPNDTAVVTVTEDQVRDPGISPGTVTKCLTDAAFNMTALLNGNPMPGSWTSCAGQNHSDFFTPGLDPACTYTYTVPAFGACPAAAAQLTVDINEPANPGLGGQTTFCGSEDPVPLINYLFGDPDQGGVWTGPGGGELLNGIFHPASDQEGNYTYTVQGDTPCPAAASVVEVFVTDPVGAGCNTTVTLCANGASVDMTTLLNCAPDPNGSWSGPVGHPGTYNPTTDSPGTFTYSVTAAPPCEDRTATLTIGEAQPNNPGCNTGISVCTSQAAFGLITRLNCGPTPGGHWFYQNTLIPGFFDPGSNPPGIYVYTYVLDATANCPQDSAKLTITLNGEADAGCDATAAFCSDSPSASLFPYLGCSPQNGGTWRGPAGVDNGIYDPASEPAGSYWYKVSASSPCLADSARVIVTRNQRPNPGNSGTLTTCDNMNTVYSLINYLSGGPDPGGTWSGPPAHPGFYIPTTDAPGVFTYTVNGMSPCAPRTAQVQVIENVHANAGNDVTLTVCTSDPDLNMLNALTGSPNPGGQWYAAGNVPTDGILDIGNEPCGTYKYKVTGVQPCVSDSAFLTVNCTQQADAGLSTANVICPTGDPFLLIDLLGGTPDNTGSWTAPNGQGHLPFFDPETDVAGTYKYVVQGTSPCSSDSAYVTIQFSTQPSAGDGGATSACTSETAVDLLQAMPGSPTPGGTWLGSGQTNGIMNPSLLQPGIYCFSYIVNGNGTCQGDTAQLCVTVTNALFAGNDNTGQVCVGGGVDLLTFLPGAQLGGIMRDLDGTNALSGTYFNASVAGVGVFGFRYVKPGTSSCQGDSAELVITVVPGPNAGSGGAIPLCSTAPSFQLITLLGGGPDAGGQWYGPPGLTIHGGAFHPETEQTGVYTYVVPAASGCPADTATVTITVDQAPDAGEFGTVTLCSNGSQTALFDHLGGTPDTGGYWTCCGGVNDDGIYTPANDNPGTWVYHVNGPGVCADEAATVLVSEQAAPIAGSDNPWPVCSSDAPFPMISHLAGTPQNGGSWTDPNGDPHPPTFDPASDLTGSYTYTVPGAPHCTNAEAHLIVTVTIAPEAGASDTIAACASDDHIDVFAALGPGADAGGSWTDLDGAGAAFQNGFLDATVIDLGTYDFAYSVPGSGPCGGDQDTVTVVVGAGLDPGQSGSATVCGGNIAYNLFNALGGSPAHSGVWIDPAGTGALTDSLLNASLLQEGGPYQFGYTVTDPGCGEASSTVTITITSYPDPGSDTSVVVCANSSTFDLYTVMGGSPDPGGTWTGPLGTAVGSTFIPGTSQPGTYHYNLTGNAPCADTSASVTVVVNQPADAGEDGALQRCDQGTLDLGTALNGAQSGGVWTDLDNAGSTGDLLPLDDLASGQYRFDYTVTVVGCGADAARIVLTVVGGVSIEDTALVCDERERTYTISFTIVGGDPSTYSVSGIQGTLSTEEPYVFTSVPNITSQPFSLVVDDANHCSPRVLEGSSPCTFSDPVFVPESFTPNGDGANDAFIIPGIEGFPENTIHIFNRWGGEVYGAAGYNNGTVVWDGTSADALIPGVASTGTYYYVLELGNGSEAIKGFVYLNR